MDFAGVHVAFGVQGEFVQPVKLTCAAASTAEGVENLHVVSSQDPDYLAVSIGDIEKRLLLIR